MVECVCGAAVWCNSAQLLVVGLLLTVAAHTLILLSRRGALLTY